jgi:glucan-binding YG repeat protein
MSAGGLTQQAEASSPPNTGWWQNPSNGHWFYYQNNAMLMGWRELPISNGSSTIRWFYLQPTAVAGFPQGAMRTGWAELPISNGSSTIRWFYLQPTAGDGFARGTMRTGWAEIPGSSGTHWYYLQPAAITGFPLGAMRTGWAQIDNHRFHFQRTTEAGFPQGAMRFGEFTDTDGHRYFLNDSSGRERGSMHIGWRQGATETFFYRTGNNIPADGGPWGSMIILNNAWISVNGSTELYSFFTNGRCLNPHTQHCVHLHDTTFRACRRSVNCGNVLGSTNGLQYMYRGANATVVRRIPSGGYFGATRPTGTHRGLDVIHPDGGSYTHGIPIYSVSGGVVVRARVIGTFGDTVIIGTQINGTNYTIVYAHLVANSYGTSEDSLVTVNTKIGNTGNTGNVDPMPHNPNNCPQPATCRANNRCAFLGTHLHFELRRNGTNATNGNPQNPRNYYPTNVFS